MELLDWKTEDLSPRSTGGILRIGIKAPTSKKTMPNDGASVSGEFELNLNLNWTGQNRTIFFCNFS